MDNLAILNYSGFLHSMHLRDIKKYIKKSRDRNYMLCGNVLKKELLSADISDL